MAANLRALIKALDPLRESDYIRPGQLWVSNGLLRSERVVVEVTRDTVAFRQGTQRSRWDRDAFLKYNRLAPVQPV